MATFEEAMDAFLKANDEQDLSVISNRGVLCGVNSAILAALSGVMTTVEFTVKGIAAGSMAAAVQSSIGNVASGSVFAAFQAFGALGGFLSMLIGGVVIGLSIVVVDYFFPSNRKTIK